MRRLFRQRQPAADNQGGLSDPQANVIVLPVTCLGCLYFDRTTPTATTGLCREASPTRAAERPDPTAHWPVVLLTDWCGAWVKK